MLKYFAVENFRSIKEELFSYPHKRRKLIYRREEDKITQGSTVNKLDAEVWSNLRDNCSIVSFAAQFNSQNIAKVCKGYDFFEQIEEEITDTIKAKIKKIEAKRQRAER